MVAEFAGGRGEHCMRYRLEGLHQVQEARAERVLRKGRAFRNERDLVGRSLCAFPWSTKD